MTPFSRGFRARKPDVVAVALACGLAAAVSSSAEAQIQWRSNPEAKTVAMNSAQVQQALREIAASGRAQHVAIQLSRPTAQAERDFLGSAGLRVLQSLGGTAYIAAVQPSVNVEQVAQTALVSNVETISPERKMHPDLNAGMTHDWMIVEQPAEIRAQALAAGADEATADKLAANPTVAVYVMMQRDVDALGAGFDAVTRHGGEVQSLVESVNALVVHIKRDQIAGLAAEDAVQWIEPPMPMMSPNNSSCRELMGVNTVNAAPYNLNGSGVTVLVYDAGDVYQHGDFAGRLTIGDSAGPLSHSTHVAGTIGGSGAGSPGQIHRGMAPGVQLVSYAFEQPGGFHSGFLYTDPGDFEADYGDAINLHGAQISNNSIGSNVESNGYECSWQGDYGLMASLIDAVVDGSLSGGDPFRVVWAAGNERQGSRCDIEGFGDYYSVAPPGAAKNQIAVGAVNSNDDSMTFFSSWGPTDDGRLKPDIVGPGCQSNDDGGVTSCNSGGGYYVSCGTSMASPAVCGVSALIMQQWHITNSGMPEMHNGTLKAILANSAVDLGNPGPDFQFGYGSVRAQPAVDTVIERRVVEAPITQGQTKIYIAVVEPGQEEFKVTMAWDDAPATPMTTSALVNDLDLRVIGPDGSVHMPWTLDPSNPSAPAVQTVADRRNNSEQVSITAPAPGAYRVEIIGHNIADGPSQTVGVAATNELFSCSSAGIVSVSGGRQPCSGNLSVDVIDCDLNADSGAIDTASVLVTSDSEPDGEIMDVVEIGAEVAVFNGSIPISTTDAPGVLHVAEGDTITVTYVDADDGHGGTNVPVEVTSQVDCTAPVLISTSTPTVEPRSATVDVAINEPASVTIHYGTSCSDLDNSVTSSQLLTDHSVTLTGLVDGQTYHYAIEMVDEAGNTSYDNNGGSCYTFDTPDVPDFMTEQFTAGSDLVGKSVTFRPNTDETDFYTSCAEDLSGGLPTDPAGGTTISLSDDSAFNVSVGGTNRVYLYGTPWSSFYVESNGNITFGTTDTGWEEDLVAHFAVPRISAWWDDLNPSVGGTVSYKRLSDRIAVTWSNVPEYFTSNRNTFQVEMFYDGTLRLSWLRLDSQDGLVGLSNGSGIDPDFEPSDLSSSAGCHVCLGDFNNDGELTFPDVQAYLNAFSSHDPAADVNGDGAFDFFDVMTFLDAFSAGCP